MKNKSKRIQRRSCQQVKGVKVNLKMKIRKQSLREEDNHKT